MAGPYQTARRIRVAYKQQSGLGNAAAAGGGANQFRVNTGGLNVTKKIIDSNEIRPDGMITRGRHGYREVKGSYEGDLSFGTFDALLAASFRNTFSAALAITQATGAMNNATLSAQAGPPSTITATAGSFINAGLRIGDAIRVPSGLVAGDLNRNLRITALTDTVITVAETLTADAGPEAAWEIDRPKKLLMGTSPIYFTFEEEELDISESEIFTDCKIGKLSLEMKPSSMVMVTFDVLGIGAQIETGGSSPYFTTPTDTTSLGLTGSDAQILFQGAPILDLTEFKLDIDFTAAGQEVIGSTVSPDIFTNRFKTTGSITALMADLVKVQDYLSETQLSFHAMFVENTAEPRNFVSVYIPNFAFGSAAKSALGSDGPRSLTLDMIIGAADGFVATDDTMVMLQTNSA
jgi:hypothetical protein